MIFLKLIVLDFPGYHNRIPWDGWLKQQKFIFLQFLKLETQYQDAIRVGFW